jgi:hypothetical protein
VARPDPGHDAADILPPIFEEASAMPTELEGTADCPVLHKIGGTVMPALTVQKFSATVK